MSEVRFESSPGEGEGGPRAHLGHENRRRRGAKVGQAGGHKEVSVAGEGGGRSGVGGGDTSDVLEESLAARLRGWGWGASGGYC